MKKRALGKGLGALIGTGGSSAAVAGTVSIVAKSTAKGQGEGGYMVCPVSDITPNKKQPRRHFEKKALAELADSIRQKGIIEPIVVRVAGDGRVGYEIIAGERRWRAARMAGLTKVPVVTMQCTDEECLELAIIENIQREDLNPIEEAEAFRALTDFGLSQEEVARKVGKERATVANYLRLLKLPPEVKEEVIKSTISMGHARAILSLDGVAAQRELCRRVVAKGLSVRDTERFAKSGAQKNSSPSASVKLRVAGTELGLLEDELRKVFGTKVHVKDKAGRGRVEIEFYTPDERERIIELLRSR